MDCDGLPDVVTKAGESEQGLSKATDPVVISTLLGIGVLEILEAACILPKSSKHLGRQADNFRRLRTRGATRRRQESGLSCWMSGVRCIGITLYEYGSKLQEDFSTKTEMTLDPFQAS